MPAPAAPAARLPGQLHPLVTRGSSKMWQGDVRAALADFKAAVEAEPGDFDARRLRATLELLAGDPAKGRDEADALLREQPNHPYAHLVRGQAALWLNDTETARKHLARAAALDPRLSGTLYQQGGQFIQAGSHSLAYLSYMTVLYLDPQSHGAYFGLGIAAAQLGQKDRAIAAFENYLRSDTTSAFAEQSRQWLARLKTP